MLMYAKNVVNTDLAMTGCNESTFAFVSITSELCGIITNRRICKPYACAMECHQLFAVVVVG